MVFWRAQALEGAAEHRDEGRAARYLSMIHIEYYERRGWMVVSSSEQAYKGCKIAVGNLLHRLEDY